MRVLFPGLLSVVVGIVISTVAGCSGGVAGGDDPGADNAAALGGDTVKTYRQVLQLARAAGLPCDEVAVRATAIARAESGFDVLAEDHDADGSTDYGLWQINSIHGYPAAWLLDSSNNATAMYAISGGGQDFTPWVTYNSGAYEAYTDDAWTAWGEYEYN